MDEYIFYPVFNGYSVITNKVISVYIGTGDSSIPNNDVGVLYAVYDNHTVSRLGICTAYGEAVADGYTGTEEEWAYMISMLETLAGGVSTQLVVTDDDAGTVTLGQITSGGGDPPDISVVGKTLVIQTS